MWKISVQIVDQVSQKNPRRSVGKIQYQYHRRSHSDRIRFLKGLLEKLGNLLWDFLQKLCEKKKQTLLNQTGLNTQIHL